MKRNAGFLLLLTVLVILLSRPIIPSEISSPHHIELRFRALRPGEVIRVILHADESVIQGRLKFLGKELLLAPHERSSIRQAFVGLDLALEPGSYPYTIALELRDGRKKTIHNVLTVLSREFETRSLWVPQRYVTPPEEAWERIEAESRLLETLFSVFTGEWLGEGSFVLPVEGRRTHNFGQRRILNDSRRSIHSGEDIPAPDGTPVRASNSGRVVFASDLYYAGKTVIIDHGLGVFSLYCHFSDIRTEKSTYVRKGSILGRVGSTGRATGPHLHWAFKVQGRAVDPDSVLSLSLDEWD